MPVHKNQPGRRGLACVAFILLCAAGKAGAADDPTQMTRGELETEAGSLTYAVFAPSQIQGKVPLFVHLPGGTDGADDAARRSRLNELAIERGFIVLYPEPARSSATGIWDGTAAAAAGRDAAPQSLIAQITREVMAAYPVDPSQVILGGTSAGGAMAIVMAAQYPELYVALQIETGDNYGKTDAATAGRAAFEAMGPRARRIPLMYSYGTLDPFSFGGANERSVEAWLIMHDWMDDGEANGSVSLQPVATREGREGKNYSVQAFADSKGCELAELWIIEGLFHAYSGGAPNVGVIDPASDPNAPNMRVKAYDFFMDQLDADGPPGCAKAIAGGEGEGGGATNPMALLVMLGLAALRARRWVRR